ncbi:hypothetical protein LOTGIDRAFT_169526 [Lottia gigantea]|uniref:Uncharacterized protein n=1 Tax=Lottia gigantea TaxID=225164 RepID=V3ZGK6_LOTGI|nr:hypothetical protein LOTGIDRAFT_169526 [Lottia gigantea]ESO83302.1 hypothetical protein LOTGIDRAFT_169526 [Lottia gigantea]
MSFKVALTLLLIIMPYFLKCLSEGRTIANSHRRTQCKMPKNLCQLRKEVIRPAALRDAFSIDLINGKNITDVPPEYIDTHHYVSGGSKICQKSSDNELCPVYYVLNVDENRIPNSFLEAVCSCAWPQMDILKDTRVECQTKNYYTKVLRRTGCDEEHNTFIYEAVWEPVRIGCVALSGPERYISLQPVSPI